MSATLLVEISVNEGIGSRGVAIQDLYVEYEEGWEYKKMYSHILSFSFERLKRLSYFKRMYEKMYSRT
jgi:hypothetical protein